MLRSRLLFIYQTLCDIIKPQPNITMIDFIGDIHGHADKLEELLLKLGYKKSNGTYSHAEEKVLFVRDYIDRYQKLEKRLKL